VLSNQHKIERTYKLAGEYLAEIEQLLTKCQPGDENSKVLLEVQSSFELIRETIDSIPAKARPHSPKREAILSLYWKAQDSLFKVRLAMAE
jgi:hypothetical protein